MKTEQHKFNSQIAQRSATTEEEAKIICYTLNRLNPNIVNSFGEDIAQEIAFALLMDNTNKNLSTIGYHAALDFINKKIPVVYTPRTEREARKIEEEEDKQMYDPESVPTCNHHTIVMSDLEGIDIENTDMEDEIEKREICEFASYVLKGLVPSLRDLITGDLTIARYSEMSGMSVGKTYNLRKEWKNKIKSLSKEI